MKMEELELLEEFGELKMLKEFPFLSDIYDDDDDDDYGVIGEY